MAIKTKIRGINQGDIILRSAILAAIEDIRRNPYLIDFMLAQLIEDPLTRSEYGADTVSRCKEWFLRTQIYVYFDTLITEAKFPAYVIKQVSSNESEVTLGDVDGTRPYENIPNFKWDNLVSPFSPVSYDPFTGTITLPQVVLDNLFVVQGMILIDGDNIQHPILDASTPNTITIAPGQFNLANSVIRGQEINSTVAAIESGGFQNTYTIGAFCDSEPEHEVFLHSMLLLIFLRYRQDLFEFRGLEKGRITSSEMVQSPISSVQAIYSRYLNFTCQVRNEWPKTLLPSIQEVVPTLSASPVNSDTPVVDLWDEGSIPSNWNFKKDCK